MLGFAPLIFRSLAVSSVHHKGIQSMLAAATSFFGRTAISQSYNIGTSGSRPSTPRHGSTSSTLPTSFSPSLYVGLWRVQSASHKVTNKCVSVWSFDKRGTDLERLSPLARERTVEVLKAEVGQMSAVALLSLNGVSVLGFCVGKAPTSVHPRWAHLSTSNTG